MRLASLVAGAAALIAPPVSVRRPASVLRADWQRYEDAASGDSYWHDADSGATTWDDPTAPVVDPYADWQAAVDPGSGGTYYYTADGRTSWDWPPVEAPKPAAADAAAALEKAAQAKADKAAQRHDPGDPCRYMSRPIKEEESVVQEEKTRLAQAVEEARNIASSAPPAGVPKDAVETVVEALPTTGPHAIVAEIGEGYAYDDLGAAITQRSVQTQLQYSAALRNEPQVSWLSKFLGHDHLGPKLRDTGSAGPPSSYTPALCQLRGNWVEYLETLGNTPDDVVEVELAQPPQRFSERQKKNPFLMAQAMKSMFYEEPIDTRWILHRLLRTADALINNWSFHYGILEETDRERCFRDAMPVKALPSVEMSAAEELRIGGETVYKTESEEMPLASFDRRLCDRLATLRALELLDKELDGLTASSDVVQAVTDCPYLRLNFEYEVRDDCQDERILAKRAARQARLEASFVEGDEEEKARSAIQGGKLFLAKFRETWAPRLNMGSRLTDLEKYARRRPGLKAPRKPGTGADADEVMEELWYFRDAYAFGVEGGELVLPGRMGNRVRELRADVAVQCRAELANEVEPVMKRLAKELPEVDEALGARTTSLTSAFRIADSSVTRQESVDRSSV
jgi:hypothetical protein